MKRCALYQILGPLTVLLTIACQDTAPDATVAGTETNWLKTCEVDSECGEFSCECGVCTQVCTRASDCSPEGAVCSRSESSEVRALCADVPEAPDLCLPAADVVTDADAFSNEPTMPADLQDAAASEPMTSLDAATSATSTERLLDAASGPSESGATDVSSEPVSTNADAASDPVPDAALPPLCAADRAGLLGGCCYDDSDCAEAESCYQADCSSAEPTPGRCASAPASGTCFDARDCAADERCEGGQLALCGTLGPDSLGTCVADCAEDRCHPERCDEPGETCCDPLPLDGPNYCGPELTCVSNVCEEQAETTTPEEQARLLCEQTGGSWDTQSCGNYSCGNPPVCTAQIPGCNCGPTSNFSELGCVEDPACAAEPAFTCGDQSCTSLEEQYCEEFTGGPGITTYTCQQLPPECVGEGCDCLVDESLPAPPTCRVGDDGELILTPAPAP